MDDLSIFVRKIHFRAVQRLTGEQVGIPSVSDVSLQGMAKIGEMYPNLMSASGFQPDPQKRKTVRICQGTVMRDRRLSFGRDRPQDIYRVYPGDRQVNGTLWRLHPPGNHSPVFLFQDFSQAKSAVSRFRHGAQAAGVSIQTV